MSANIPTYDSMMKPLLEALKLLGGSGNIDEIASKVSEIMKLSDAQFELMHNPDKGGRTEFEYRLAWTRTYLKKYGLLENSERGIWSLTQKGRNAGVIDEKAIVKHVKEMNKRARAQRKNVEQIVEDVEALAWEDELLEVILSISPDAFERLFQRILRESGFVQVEVTGRSGDGGIDGKGIMRLGDILSFHVFFQCKRYKGKVNASQVRDFRGAMSGRADKGLIVTTGYFTKAAIEEATRDGAPPVDLIDGDQLVLLLKKLNLGVSVKPIIEEEVVIDKAWYEGI